MRRYYMANSSLQKSYYIYSEGLNSSVRLNKIATKLSLNCVMPIIMIGLCRNCGRQFQAADPAYENVS